MKISFVSFLAMMTLASVVVAEQSVMQENGEGILLEEQESDCPEESITFCSRESNRYCYLVQDGDGDSNAAGFRCGTCLPGFIEFQARCINEDKVDILLFLQEYAPEYLEPMSTLDRAKLLIEAVRFITASNNQNPPPPYELGLNKFSADSDEDLLARTGYDASVELDLEIADGINNTPPPPIVQSEGGPLTSIDWVEEKGVTPVKDQGRCGCCWAVATAGAIEGATYVNTGYLQSLSFQQLISCDDRNFGCNGGNLVYAMYYALTNGFGGIARDGSYSYSDYKGSTTEECEVAGKSVAVEIKEASYVVDFLDDISFDERVERMKAALSNQPVAIVMKTACKLFTNYKSGVLTDDSNCAVNEPYDIDHAVLMVGYNDTHDPPYWKIKNSWSTGWGEDGYVRIAQTEKGPYGLFGVVVHGVVPDLAVNVTEQVFEPAEIESRGGDDDKVAEPWVWVVVVLAILGCLCFCFIGANSAPRRKPTQTEDD